MSELLDWPWTTCDSCLGSAPLRCSFKAKLLQRLFFFFFYASSYKVFLNKMPQGSPSPWTHHVHIQGSNNPLHNSLSHIQFVWVYGCLRRLKMTCAFFHVHLVSLGPLRSIKVFILPPPETITVPPSGSCLQYPYFHICYSPCLAWSPCNYFCTVMRLLDRYLHHGKF